MRFSGVIFDLDGTLLDTIEDIGLTMNLVFGRRGFPPFSIADCMRMVGDGMEVLVRRALPGGSGDEALVDEIVQEYREAYGLAWRDHSRPYPGVPELLEGLKARGVRSAVLSNKSHPFTEIMTRELLPFDFDAVLGALPGMPFKPDPSAALRIASDMGLPPAGFVFVGDTDIDMETARAAGMYPAGALWGFRDAANLRAGGAEVLLASPGDLLRLFD
ncbi:MAG: HAD family hydrolase [Candidatus Aminicenantes bacterium]|nr:HAD family hydrolase [Candidatus Aminicenantes bacterium]